MTNVILDADDCGYCATLTTLDTRHNDLTTVATRRFIAYIRREGIAKRRVLICERTATGLGEPLALLPGAMEATVTLDAEQDTIVVTYTGREAGDDTGPFMLQEARIQVLGIYPIDLAAALRVRFVARIVTKYLPSAALELAPYTK